MNNGLIPIIIPSYEPTYSFIEFVKKLCGEFDQIIIVDDGSGINYNKIFSEIEKNENAVVLRHAVNLGKGRSIKDAFNYVMIHYPEAVGVVTADSDGQHLIEDIKNIVVSLYNNPNDLVLGCRDFKQTDIPWKSRIGNDLTQKICSFLCGLNVSDTQTGLRGIPTNFLNILMHTPGERYEYETNMLLECNNSIQIIEVPISTVYESVKNHKTHFEPLRDSITIYKVILAYSLTSILATFIDFMAFFLMTTAGIGIWIATLLSRAFAASTNFLLNKNIVFKSTERGGNSAEQLLKYSLLVGLSGTISAFTVSILWQLFSVNLIVLKIVVEIFLFFFNYYVQRTYIFAKKKYDEIEKSIFSDDINENTNWTRYYESKKSWISTFTQRYTLKEIINAIDKYFVFEKKIDVCELGGGNSCFAYKLCNIRNINNYDIIDNNELAVDLFNKQTINSSSHLGTCLDILCDDFYCKKKYDFVYSVGLIEHFRGNDIRTVVNRHFNCCKDGGVVLITFPTPTRKYVFVRKVMEFLGAWKFYDERPIRYEEVSEIFELQGCVLEHYINRKLLLTQEIVIIRKNGGNLCQ